MLLSNVQPHKHTTDWYDIAKGIGIILVVLGHGMFPLHSLIDSFHMPLFFVLSGMFIHFNKYTVKDYVFKKFKRIMVPFCIYTALYWSSNVLLGIEQPTGMLWFLYTLFVSISLYYIIGTFLPAKILYACMLIGAIGYTAVHLSPYINFGGAIL